MAPLSFSMRRFLYSLHAFVLLALALVMAGCGGAPDAGPPDGGPADCAAGELLLDGGGCQPAGLPPDMQCAPGEMPLDDGGCQPAGVPPEACGQGFEPDGNQGCNAILPVDPCPKGLMAVPGDAQCHEVAPCGTGDYGMIPGQTGATTQFVKGNYAGNDSDGTLEKPWTHIQDGIDHAAKGAVVAVAAGIYAEDVLIQVRPVQVWGRCPAMVEVVGTGAALATVQVLHNSASQSEVHDLAITGKSGGIGMSGASDVIVDHVWVHDTMAAGIDVEDGLGKTSITISASLIEATTDTGVFVAGSNSTIEKTVVRDTRFHSDGTHGEGIWIDNHLKTRATLSLRGSLVEQNFSSGVLVRGSDATIESTAVRATKLRSDGIGGIGILIQDQSTLSAHARAKLTLRTSLVEQNHEVGVFVEGSDATIDATIVRGTQPVSDGTLGDGIAIQDDTTTHEHANVTLRTSLVEQNHEAGVLVFGSAATMDAIIVRSTQPGSNEGSGRGIAIVGGATGTLRTSLVQNNYDAGVFVGNSDAMVEATVVRETQPRSDGTTAGGIEVIGTKDGPRAATLTLRASLLEQNHDVGVFVQSSNVTIETTVIRATQLRSDGTSGFGIVVQDQGVKIQGVPSAPQRATLMLRASLIDQNHSVGVLVIGSDATLEATVVRATQSRSDGWFGRGIDIEWDTTAQERSRLTLRTTLVENNNEVGVFVSNSDATIDATVVRGTQAVSDGFGDGIVVELNLSDPPSKATITSTQAEANARAGLLFDDSAGTLSGVTSTNNQYGLVLQGKNSPDYTSGENDFAGNAKQDIYLNGDLTVPDTASPIPSSP